MSGSAGRSTKHGDTCLNFVDVPVCVALLPTDDMCTKEDKELVNVLTFF